jgi:hypothetical protein
MAWGDLASNQMVSYADATSGGFTIKPGQTNPGTLQCMTKSQAFDMYYLQTTANTNTVASNQLMRKDYWTAATVLPYSYTLYYSVQADVSLFGFTTSSAACSSVSPSITVYSSSSAIAAGMALFYDQYGNNQIYASGYAASDPYFKLNDSLVRFQQNDPETLQGYVLYDVSTCVVNSVVFSSFYSYTGSGSANYSGTVTITGASATFNARSTSTGNFSTDTNINIGGNARRARQTTTGTLNSTTFTLTPGTYSYTFSCQVTGGGTGIGQIIFTQ